MQKIFLFAFLILSGLVSFSQNEKIIHDKNAAPRNLSSFHAISVAGGIDLYLSSGKDQVVAVSASDVAIRDLIVTEVENGTLKIYIDEKARGRHFNNAAMKAYVSFTQLDALRASGGSDVYTEDLTGLDKLAIGLSGGSDLKGKINAAELSFNQSGGSDVEVKGAVGSLLIDASGGSDFSGYGLSSDISHVKVSGGSDIHITVNKQLFAVASGDSDVHYKGSGVLMAVSSSGSGGIHKAD